MSLGQRGVECFQRFIETVRPVVTCGQIEARLDVAAILFQQSSEFLNRAGQMAGIGQPDGTAVASVLFQSIFWIRSGASPRGTSGEISQGAEPR